MNYFHLAIISAILIAMAVLFNRIKIREEQKKNAPPEEEDEFPDMNEIFLSHGAGREVVDLVRVYKPQDKAVLRSILFAEGIDTYVKSNHFGELYPTYDIHNFATSEISVFREDSQKAKEIVADYIRTLKSESYEKHQDGGAVVTGAVLTGVPPHVTHYLPDLLI